MSRTILANVLLAFVTLLFASPANAQSFLPVYERGYGEFVVDQIIGGDIDDEENYLYIPTDMGLDSSQNLFVLDYKGFCLKKVDGKGAHLATFSRKGEGPGEMLRGFRIAVDPNDVVALYDLSLRRFSFFDNTGQFVNSVNCSELGFRYVVDFAFDNDCHLYVKTEESKFGHTRGTTIVSISRWSLNPFEETVIETKEIHQSYTKHRNGGTVTITAPFHSDIYWSVLPVGKIITVNSADYTVKIYSSDLRMIEERRIASERRSITSEDKKEYFASFGEGPDQVWMREVVEFPKFMPHFSQLNIDHEGYVLLDRDEGEGDEGLYHVLTPDGNFFGEVKLPRLKRSAILVNGMIYNVELHEDQDYAVYRYCQK